MDFPKMKDKIVLRKHWKDVRQSISTLRIQQASLNLIKIDLPKGKILSFMTFQTEIDTLPLNTSLCQQNRLLLPKMIEDRIHVFKVKDLSHQLQYSSAGILEPREDLCEEIKQFDAILVPGLAFDYRGFRLGYGKGHYDRFLSTCNAISIGVGFIEQLSPLLPIEAHDVAVNRVDFF